LKKIWWFQKKVLPLRQISKTNKKVQRYETNFEIFVIFNLNMTSEWMQVQYDVNIKEIFDVLINYITLERFWHSASNTISWFHVVKRISTYYFTPYYIIIYMGLAKKDDGKMYICDI